MARSKSKRLVDLVTLLLSSPYPVSREEIRGLEGYPRGDEAFHRQFERDKQALREMGFPLREVGDDEEKAYALDRQRLRLRDVQLTPEETVALALARRLAGLHGLLGGNVRDAMGKLGLMSESIEPVPGVACAVSTERGRGEEERLRLLETAIARGQRLRLRYRKLGDPQAVERTVDPYGLYVYGGAWYVVAWDHLRGARRTFRVGRIEKLARSARGAAPEFEVPADFRLEDHVERMRFEGWRGIVDDAVIRFAAGEAWRVGRLAGRRTVVRRAPDGAVEVRLRRANPDAVIAYVARLGRGVTVLEPAGLRDEARRIAERVARLHSGAPTPTPATAPGGRRAPRAAAPATRKAATGARKAPAARRSSAPRSGKGRS